MYIVGINQELQTEDSGPDRNTANHRIKKAQVCIEYVANQIALFVCVLACQLVSQVSRDNDGI